MDEEKVLLEELSAHLSLGRIKTEKSLHTLLMIVRTVSPRADLLPIVEQVFDQLWGLCGSQQWAYHYEELVNVLAQPWLDQIDVMPDQEVGSDQEDVMPDHQDVRSDHRAVKPDHHKCQE